ncbi:MAG TPA: NlpC/P60 family protein [Phycisphaerae bacterium]|jgi:hypothetical protein|nr:NlpC/P60 family protein [Phycisphaerae bacterium]HOL25675.1 NlpC/P60 family protein [Phycisphaerae bacterium]
MATGFLGFRRRLVLFICWAALWPVWFVLAWYPISTGLTRMAAVVLVLMLWAGAVGLSWRWRPLRGILLGLTAIVLILPLLPGRQTDPTAMRNAHVQSLRGYHGAPYVWGGENRCGIDCSGLVRKGLVWADLRRGLMSLDDRLLRRSLDLWWHDASASHLGDGYGGRTRRICTTAGINQLDHAGILPGDFAITATGIHALVYIGDQNWMEADPGAGKVITVRVPTNGIGWFDQPIHVMRWTQFD